MDGDPGPGGGRSAGTADRGQDTRAEQTSLEELAQSDGMTQEEMAVELLRALDGAELAPPDCVPGQEMFDDVPASSPFCPFIEELARRDITTGCGGDNFCPGATVTRAQMATFIVRTLEEADGCRPAVPGTGAMRKVGSTCIDRHENSIWTQPDGGTQITGEIPCSTNGQDCDNWSATFGDDLTCVGRGDGDATTRFPAALVRGGSLVDGASAGPFAILGAGRPSNSGSNVGFRGAR